MNIPQPLERVSAIRLGDSPAFDAWFYSFRAENNIEHSINPTDVSGPEQLRFMVALDDRQVYVPCSDLTFRELFSAYRKRSFSPHLLRQYTMAWLAIARVIRRVPDREKRRSMLNYCRYRFNGSLALGNILPSRLVKRLITTFISQFERDDPWADPWVSERMYQNRELLDFFASKSFMTAIGRLPKHTEQCVAIDCLRRMLDLAELSRLFQLAGRSEQSLTAVMDKAIRPDGACSGSECIFEGSDEYTEKVATLLGPENTPRTFLYLCDTEGGLALDLRIVQTLLRLGHKVVLSLKEFPLYHAPTIWDLDRDPLLLEKLPEARVLRDKSVSKNNLLRCLRERRLLIISDGTGERLNLYRTSVTFSRAWKESDAVLSKGRSNKDVLLETSHSFTRDIFCFWEEGGKVHMKLKRRAPGIRKFSEQGLTEKAASIIRNMRTARDEGKSVMFYSCIIGSIPGQTKTAVKVAETFVEHLRQRLDSVFIINPADYFEPGMDGDDLMFMWEQVQRSGLITIWRFQSMEDIETSFSLMGRKVPSTWSGKDATYSTGCTKEMRIALDMQRSHPELQIIGPGPENFFRRGEYGVGKFFDSTLTSSSQDFL